MDRMTLHWSPKSPFVRKVMVAAYETGLEPHIDRVRSVAAMQVPNLPLMQDNPIGKIPVLVLHDGSKLYDSRVICEYLDSLHDGPKLFPAGAARWDALRRQALGDGVLDFLLLWRHERERGENAVQALLDAFALKLDKSLTLLETEAQGYTPRNFDIGQVILGCVLGYLDFRFADIDWRGRFPGLARFYGDFQARPSAQATEIVDG